MLSGKRLKWPRLNLGLKVSQAFSFVPRDQKLEPGSGPEVCPVPPDMQTPRKDFHVICTLLCFLIRRNKRTLAGAGHSPEFTSSCNFWVSRKAGKGDETLKLENTDRGF